MGVELEELLRRSAAAPPGPPDLHGLIDAGVRRRRRRRAMQGGGTLAIVLVVAVGLLGLPTARVQIAGPSAGIDWPLAARYDIRDKGPDGQPRTRVVEVVANGWDDWMIVGDPGDGRAVAERFGPAGRLSAAEVGEATLLDDPWAALEAAAAVELEAVDQPTEGGFFPGMYVNPTWADRYFTDIPDGARVSEATAVLEQVASRLGLPKAGLDSGRLEFEDCWEGSCGTWVTTSVWEPKTRLPLLVELTALDGTRDRAELVDLREGAMPPPNPGAPGVPVPPGWTREPAPVEEAGFEWGGASIGVSGGSSDDSAGDPITVSVSVAQLEPDAVLPVTLTLERWDGTAWADEGRVKPRLGREGDDPDILPADVPSGSDVVPPGSMVELQARFEVPADTPPGVYRVRSPAGATVTSFLIDALQVLEAPETKGPYGGSQPLGMLG